MRKHLHPEGDHAKPANSPGRTLLFAADPLFPASIPGRVHIFHHFLNQVLEKVLSRHGLHPLFFSVSRGQRFKPRRRRNTLSNS